MDNKDKIIVDNYYDYLVRTIGPKTWLYEYLTTEPWDEFQASLGKYTTETGRYMFIYIKYVERENKLVEEQEANKKRAIWCDNQEMNRLYGEYSRKLESAEYDFEIVISEYENATEKFKKYYKVRDLPKILENAEGCRKRSAKQILDL
jgi:hypothetical protein